MSDDPFRDLSNWVLTDGRRASDLGAFISGYCEVLRSVGLPVDRATIGSPLLHPVAQSAFAIWDSEKGIIVDWVKWDERGLERLRNSPVYPVYSSGEKVDWRLTEPGAADRFEIGPELVEAGFVHYLSFPLPFSDGAFKTLTAQTKTAGGFADADIALMASLLPAVATVLEAYVQRRLAQTLMDTYVGARAGARVLDGQIALGDGDTIRAVIWMSDLRGFTTLAGSLPREALMDRLNRYFATVTGAVTEAGGEVLKFIGDAVLAVFPVGDDARRAVAQAESAVAATLAARAHPDWPSDLDFGVGLHLGDVFYGNIGAETRLDFTVIGPSVNLVSRVEGQCRELGEPVLVTGDIVAQSDRAYRPCGEHTLKGVADPVALFGLE